MKKTSPIRSILVKTSKFKGSVSTSMPCTCHLLGGLCCRHPRLLTHFPGHGSANCVDVLGVSLDLGPGMNSTNVGILNLLVVAIFRPVSSCCGRIPVETAQIMAMSVPDASRLGHWFQSLDHGSTLKNWLACGLPQFPLPPYPLAPAG